MRPEIHLEDLRRQPLVPVPHIIHKQDEVRAAHESELSKSKYHDEVYLGIEGAERKADSIVQANEWFKSTDFLKIMVASNLSSFKLSAYAISIVSFYIFFTSRDATITGTEFAAFLGSRGGHFYDKKGVEHFKPGRPVVLRHTKKSHLYRHESKSDGSIITRNQMINDLGFKVVTLFTSSIKINARDVEDALQLRFQGLPFGCRLWRSPDQGAKFEMPDGKVHSVGIAYSDQIVPMINAGMLEVCK